VGNLFSVRSAFEHCGAEIEFCSSENAIEGAERLVLPGVGAFVDAMSDMWNGGLVEPVRAFAQKGGALLGICLGMQMLFEESEEFGLCQGLGLIPGGVTAIPSTAADGRPHRLPHVGWNELMAPHGGKWSGTLLDGVEPGSSVYFAHSFRAQPANPDHLLAGCDYNGRSISAVVQTGNIWGCQFHPEKSGEAGLAILRNFLAVG
jgi:glutamine amidotransferase